MKIYVGTSGYGYKEWKGKFYPEKISPKEMLRFYSQRLGAVEINNTFYHMPTADVLDSWAEQVPADFVFALKAPQVITHYRRLRHVGEEARYLFGTLPVLGRKLGPVLFQFPGSFHADRPLLEAFIDLIPRNISAAFEFRDPSWLDDEILALLRERECVLCIADTDENARQCGWLKDKFSLSWQIVPTVLSEMLNDPDPVKSQRVMQAMLQMKKIEIAGLKKAYEQK